MAKLQIIAASIRPTRIGYSVAQWIYQNAEVQHGFSEVELVDQVKKALERSPAFVKIAVDHAAAAGDSGKIDFTISAGSREAALGAN